MNVLGKLVLKGLELLGLTDIGSTYTGVKALFIDNTTKKVLLGDVPNISGFKSIVLTSGNVNVETTYSTGFPEYYSASSTTLGGALPESFGQLISYKLSGTRLHQYFYPKNKNDVYFRAFDYDTTNAFLAWKLISDTGGGAGLTLTKGESALAFNNGNALSGNTYYFADVTLSGLVSGDYPDVGINETFANALFTAGIRLESAPFSVVTGANTVRVYIQVSSFVSGNANYKAIAKIIK